MKYKLMVLGVSIICVICFMLCLSCCEQKDFQIKDESFFSGFNIEDGKVYVHCMLYIDNFTGTDKNIKLKALLEDDVKNGLLKEAEMGGYSIDGSTQCFQLKKGENRFEVVFVGEHAGGKEKQDKLLPDIKIQEIK